ncbi:MAG: hypothetical protein COA77_10645 [Thaumarchaeota archaeon]|nr:MAG: hypothetical protein COA77_10645 [Nitrososphaerota archaeon]
MERKGKSSIIILSVIISLSLIPAYAEIDQNRLPMTLDWKIKNSPDETSRSLQNGDKILVYGTINAGYESTFEIGEIQTDVSLVLSDPTRERIGLEQVEPVCAYDQCYFEWIITVGGPLWKHTGQYEIQACYLGYNNPNVHCASTVISYTQETQSSTEPKSIQSIIALKPYDNGGVQINVKFLDVIGQIINHVNYDIIVKHNSIPILEEQVHIHDGESIHITRPLESNSNNRIDVEITFLGIGINEPYGGPIGKVFQMTEYLELAQDDSSSIAELQYENKILKEEISQLKSQITQLQNKIDNLSAIVLEQVSVIYKWFLEK